MVTIARCALAEGRFDREVVPFGEFRMDETARVTTLEKMATRSRSTRRT